MSEQEILFWIALGCFGMSFVLFFADDMPEPIKYLLRKIGALD
jgi:hypothetical protein